MKPLFHQRLTVMWALVRRTKVTAPSFYSRCSFSGHAVRSQLKVEVVKTEPDENSDDGFYFKFDKLSKSDVGIVVVSTPDAIFFFCRQTFNKLGLADGLHSTGVAFSLLTQRPRVWFSAFPRLFLLMLMRFIACLELRPEAWLCQWNPPSSG